MATLFQTNFTANDWTSTTVDAGCSLTFNTPTAGKMRAVVDSSTADSAYGTKTGLTAFTSFTLAIKGLNLVQHGGASGVSAAIVGWLLTATSQAIEVQIDSSANLYCRSITGQSPISGSTINGSDYTLTPGTPVNLLIQAKVNDYFRYYVNGTLVYNLTGLSGGAATTLVAARAGIIAVPTTWSGTDMIVEYDDMTVTDTPTDDPYGDLGTSAADSIGIADSRVTTALLLTTVVDGITVTEGIATSKSNVTTAADSIGLSETAATGSSVGVSDTITISDSVNTSAPLSTTASDSIGVAESRTQMVNFVGSSSDTVGLAESLTPVGLHPNTAQDLVILSEVANDVATFVSTSADSIGVVEGTALLSTKASTSSDTVGISEGIAQHLIGRPNVADAVGVGEQVTMVQGARSTSLDTIGIVEGSPAPHVTRPTTSGDSLGVSEGTALLHLAPSTVADGIGIAESVVRLRQGRTTATDGMGVADIARASVPYGSTSVDAIAVGDSSVGIKGYVTTGADIIGVNDISDQETDVNSDLDPDFTLSDFIGLEEFAQGRIGGNLVLAGVGSGDEEL